MSPRRSLTLAAVAALGVGSVIAAVVAFGPAEPDRAFMPGPLGRVQTRPWKTSEPAVHADGYVTRNFGLRNGEEAAWGQANGLTAGLPFSHNLNRVFPPQLAASHPEFFPLVEGKRAQPQPGSGYWNPDLGRLDVAHWAADAAKRHFESHPDALSFALGINDGWVFGDSPETRALVTPPRYFRGRPDYSALVYTFMNRAAAELARTYPQKYLGSLAYYWCENAPPFPVHPQVIPFLTADRAQNYDPAFRREELDLQRRWAEAMDLGARTSPAAPEQPSGQNAGGTSASPKRRLGLYDYLDGYGFVVPRVPIRAFAEHIRHAHRVGFTDYYGEAPLNWGLTGPLHWVIARLLQNPEQPLEPLLDEYYRRFFGPAAAPMRRFFERCEEQWMRQTGPSYWLKHYRSESQALLFPPEVCAELRGLLTQAARDAQAAEGSVIRRAAAMFAPQPFAERVAFVADSFAVTEAYVAFYHARVRLSRFALGEGDRAAGDALLAEYAARRRDFIRTAVETTRRWPLAFYPLNYDDWLRNDPALAAGLRLAGAATSETAAPLASESAAANAAALKAAHTAGRTRERLAGGDLRDPLVPGRRIADLQYGIALPRGWQSAMEPTENGVAELRDTPAGRALRIERATTTTAFQWVTATPGKVCLASVKVRGRVSPTNAVTVVLGWLDRQQKPIGMPIVMRLPDGEWPEFVTLQQGAKAPENAAWVGFAVRVMNQMAGDWTEFAAPSLLETQE